MLLGDHNSAVLPATYQFVGQSFHGMGGMEGLGFLGAVLGHLHALTAEERKAKQVAAAAERLANAHEKAAARATTQQEHQANKLAAAQARQIQKNAEQVGKRAEAAKKQTERVAAQAAKKAARVQRKLLGRTVAVSQADASKIDKLTPVITDVAGALSTAMKAVLKAKATRNASDRTAAMASVKTAVAKAQSAGLAPGSGGMRGLGALGIDVQPIPDGYGGFIDPGTGQPTDQYGTPVGQQPANPYGTPIDPNTGLPYTSSGSPYGIPSVGSGFPGSTTGLFPQPYTPQQLPAGCAKNPNKPVCMMLIMEQSSQAQMQPIFTMLQNMFAQLMDLVNQLLAQQYQTSQAAAAGSIYGQGIPPSPYGGYPGDPYGGQPGYGAPGYYSGYGSPGGDVSQIPAGYDVGGGDPFSGGGDAATNAAYQSAGPGQSTGPYGGPPGGIPQGYGPPDGASNIISSDSLPMGTEGSGDDYSGGDASQIAPPSMFGASNNYTLPPPPQYQQAPVQYGPTQDQVRQMMANQAMSASVNQGPNAQMVMAAPGPVYAQGGSVYLPDGVPMWGQQPAQTWPAGAQDYAPGGTPQYASESLRQQLQLPGPGGDELVGESFE